ncbi:MAG TPA: aldolase catalytic domain-containing protein [Candidatus Brocadiia bacterium]|nr:aldolase catalytic domain-containing protein [Candidatus Brocadiia bacterium]
MFRESIKVLDCTLRDGGICNNWDFSVETVRAIYKALSDAGVDYMEFGYRASKKQFPPSESGLWRYCDDDVVRKAIEGIESNMKLGFMVDVGRVELDAVLPADQSVFDFIRVACYVKEVDKAIFLVNHFNDKGYNTTINLMAISQSMDVRLDEALQQIQEETRCFAVYAVDSFGSIYCEDIDFIMSKFQSQLKDKIIGFHGHNNQQLAYANSIQAIIRGADILDATIYGLGRAAGNCPLELLLSFLKNPKYNVRPILDVIASHFIPLGEKIEWGYLIPYMITGALNEHPRPAMTMMDSPTERNKFRELYDSLTSDEDAP